MPHDDLVPQGEQVLLRLEEGRELLQDDRQPGILGDACAGLDRSVHRRPEVVPIGEDDLLLGPEVPVEGRWRHCRRGTHVLDGDRVEPVLPEQLQGGLLDARAPVLP